MSTRHSLLYLLRQCSLSHHLYTVHSDTSTQPYHFGGNASVLPVTGRHLLPLAPPTLISIYHPLYTCNGVHWWWRVFQDSPHHGVLTLITTLSIGSIQVTLSCVFLHFSPIYLGLKKFSIVSRARK